MSVHRLASVLFPPDGTKSTSSSIWARRLALLGGIVLLGSFLSVLYHITDVVGGTFWLLVVVGIALVTGTVAARTLPLGIGLGVCGCLLGLGLGAYVVSIPYVYASVLSFGIVTDLVELVLGEMAILEIVRADLWAITIAPAPVFGTWYLLVRRRYDLGAWVGGLTLGFFVLTGDAGETVALLGVTSVLAVLGFGTLDDSGATWDQIRNVGLLLAGVIVSTRLARPVTASVLFSSGGSPLASGSGSSQTPTIEGNLLNSPSRVGIRGSISLSPEVRFTVTADRPAFWHVAAYDRFTGGSWVRSGESTDYAGSLHPPPGDTETIRQTFEANSVVHTMPAAWKPVSVGSDVASRTQVTDLDGLQPTRSFSNGVSYSVTSKRPTWTDEQLEDVPSDIPESIRNRYLQLPASTPERVRRFAVELTADVDTQFEKAVRIEQWLEANKAYSLDVTRPNGNVADAFVFDMEQGYCVYFATAMTVMLRTLDVPARFTVGYTTGQQVAEDEWLIRGLDSHAWVDVYFPDVGWIPFDSTPGGPRQAAREWRLQEERSSNTSGTDSVQSPSTTTATGTSTSSNATDPPTSTTDRGENRSQVDDRRGAVTPDREQTTTQGSAETPSGYQDGSRRGHDSTGLSRRSLFTELSRGDQVALVAGFVGLALGASRVELLKRGYRVVELHWQRPTESPRVDVERAFDRLETVLARRYRERRDGETRRAYVRAIQQADRTDERLDRVLQIYERSVYKGEVSRNRADEARTIVDEFVREHSLLGRRTSDRPTDEE